MGTLFFFIQQAAEGDPKVTQLVIDRIHGPGQLLFFPGRLEQGDLLAFLFVEVGEADPQQADRLIDAHTAVAPNRRLAEVVAQTY